MTKEKPMLSRLFRAGLIAAFLLLGTVQVYSAIAGVDRGVEGWQRGATAIATLPADDRWVEVTIRSRTDLTGKVEHGLGVWVMNSARTSTICQAEIVAFGTSGV
jgi:hypothetical protein